MRGGKEAIKPDRLGDSNVARKVGASPSKFDKKRKVQPPGRGPADKQELHMGLRLPGNKKIRNQKKTPYARLAQWKVAKKGGSRLHMGIQKKGSLGEAEKRNTQFSRLGMNRPADKKKG